ncbi:MAG: hypothetical protein GX595_13150 [Lentisphaerae bacterium]|nr:hypothetical protein [Lentisphaerota bacterium]
MRTVAGLITGLALGILLMYFSLSTVEVGRLSAPPPGAALAAEGSPGAALARRLGAAAGAAAAAAGPETATLLAVADPAAPLAAAALEGFREAIAAHPGMTLVAVASPAEAAARLDAAAALFCPDHRDLQRLRDEVTDRALPPAVTIGWSDWLLDPDRSDRPPIAGVAVPHPAAALRRLTPRWDTGDDTSGDATEPATAVTVLSPAELRAAFALPESPAGQAAAESHTHESPAPRTQGVP